jgi:hypothetical protein
LSWFQNSLLPTTKSSAPTTNTSLLYFQYTRLPRWWDTCLSPNCA